MTKTEIEELLQQWEETYKKGLLTFWLLLILSKRKAYPYEMKSAITELSQGTMTAEDNSIYRALRRLSQSGIVDSELRPSDTGPSRRYFFITEVGHKLLTNFIQRNIHVFQHPEVSKYLKPFESVDA
jgi:DNA-binding PadR family transcriptional regulator